MARGNSLIKHKESGGFDDGADYTRVGFEIWLRSVVRKHRSVLLENNYSLETLVPLFCDVLFYSILFYLDSVNVSSQFN